MGSLEILLVHQSDELADAWRQVFANEPNVELVSGDITTVACDAVVSPANSFGFMDGGLDQALSERLGWGVQESLQRMIRSLPEGELLIGKAMVLRTGDDQIPFLIAAPTMRVPMSFNVSSSVNAYLAMKAILIAASNHREISRVAIPGLCTGVGRMPYVTAATQMHCAYTEVIGGNRLVFSDFGEAQAHQIALNPDGLIWDF